MPLTKTGKSGLIARVVLITAFAGWALGGARAAEPEVRTFAVTIDGKAAGGYTLTTSVDAAGVETVTTTASVKTRIKLVAYTYDSKCVEVWKKGELVSLDATTNDNGKKTAVKAVAADGKLNVAVGGQTRKIDADVLTSAGVRPPGGDKARDAVLLDPEDGSATAVRVEPLGACKVVINGKTIEGQRYKLTGKDVTAEWWYDADGRLVRQEMKWDGHTVVFTLTAVGR